MVQGVCFFLTAKSTPRSGSSTKISFEAVNGPYDCPMTRACPRPSLQLPLCFRLAIHFAHTDTGRHGLPLNASPLAANPENHCRKIIRDAMCQFTPKVLPIRTKRPEYLFVHGLQNSRNPAHVTYRYPERGLLPQPHNSPPIKIPCIHLHARSSCHRSRAVGNLVDLRILDTSTAFQRSWSSPRAESSSNRIKRLCEITRVC